MQISLIIHLRLPLRYSGNLIKIPQIKKLVYTPMDSETLAPYKVVDHLLSMNKLKSNHIKLFKQKKMKKIQKLKKPRFLFKIHFLMKTKVKCILVKKKWISLKYKLLIKTIIIY